MAEGAEIRIDGAAVVIRRLNEYSLQLGDRVMALALRSGANHMKKAIQNAAPVGNTGRLRRSIKVKLSKLNSRRRNGTIGFYVKPAAGKSREDTKGAYYAPFVENGYEVKGRNIGQRLYRVGASGLRSGRKTQASGKVVPGQEFIKKAYDSNKEAALRIITESIERGSEDLIRRLNL